MQARRLSAEAVKHAPFTDGKNDNREPCAAASCSRLAKADMAHSIADERVDVQVKCENRCHT